MPELTPNQFETFLLIYAAHVDYNYSESEKEYILSHTTREDYDAMHHLFHSVSEYQGLKVILDCRKKYFQSKEEQHLMQDKIVQLFQSDGEYSRAEKVFLSFLDKMIDAEI